MFLFFSWGFFKKIILENADKIIRSRFVGQGSIFVLRYTIMKVIEKVLPSRMVCVSSFYVQYS